LSSVANCTVRPLWSRSAIEPHEPPEQIEALVLVAGHEDEEERHASSMAQTASEVFRKWWALFKSLRLAQQLRQLGDVGGDAPALVAGEEVTAERRSISPSK
jgi:hypothetical protein